MKMNQKYCVNEKNKKLIFFYFKGKYIKNIHNL